MSEGINRTSIKIGIYVGVLSIVIMSATIIKTMIDVKEGIIKSNENAIKSQIKSYIASDSFDIILKSKMKNSVKENAIKVEVIEIIEEQLEIKDYDAKIKSLDLFDTTMIEKDIQKQIQKIKECPEDVKTEDLKFLIKTTRWMQIQNDYEFEIEVLKDFVKKNI